VGTRSYIQIHNHFRYCFIALQNPQNDGENGGYPRKKSIFKKSIFHQMSDDEESTGVDETMSNLVVDEILAAAADVAADAAFGDASDAAPGDVADTAADNTSNDAADPASSDVADAATGNIQ
jgi:hypothetical protein